MTWISTPAQLDSCLSLRGHGGLNSHPLLASLLQSTLTPQVVQTLSAVDRDEPEEGHHFLFSLSEAVDNLSFALRDNKGNDGKHADEQPSVALRFCPLVCRQHGVRPDAARRLPAAGRAAAPPAGGGFGQQPSPSQQHQHSVHHGLHL